MDVAAAVSWIICCTNALGFFSTLAASSDRNFLLPMYPLPFSRLQGLPSDPFAFLRFSPVAAIPGCRHDHAIQRKNVSDPKILGRGSGGHYSHTATPHECYALTVRCRANGPRLETMHKSTSYFRPSFSCTVQLRQTGGNCGRHKIVTAQIGQRRA